MDFVTITLVVLMFAASVSIVAALVFAVGNVRALVSRPHLLPAVSLGLKASVIVAAALILPPGALIGSRLGYMQPLIVFGGVAIPLAVVFLVMDIRQLRNRRHDRADVRVSTLA